MHSLSMKSAVTLRPVFRARRQGAAPAGIAVAAKRCRAVVPQRLRCSASASGVAPIQPSPVALKAAAVFQSAFQSLRTRLQKFCADTEAATADGASFQQKLKFGSAALPLLASAAGVNSTLPLITSAVASFIKLYLLLLFVRVLLTWFPNVDWQGQPWGTLRQVTDPYLNLFRNLIPPLMGQIDFTPIFGFMVLQFLVQVLGTDDIYSI